MSELSSNETLFISVALVSKEKGDVCSIKDDSPPEKKSSDCSEFQECPLSETKENPTPDNPDARWPVREQGASPAEPVVKAPINRAYRGDAPVHLDRSLDSGGEQFREPARSPSSSEPSPFLILPTYLRSSVP
ncbi:hypothetical protein K0M31_004286 [Melipona bicolor]|uniref:Uncharacterized protein n=1 Tax=Melipona bicolor TaxID=60889 RepID=A0AA40FX63_9HYME|nr:hypothetical protein K0M31_004286 [Melipona bicolor]